MIKHDDLRFLRSLTTDALQTLQTSPTKFCNRAFAEMTEPTARAICSQAGISVKRRRQHSCKSALKLIDALQALENLREDCPEAGALIDASQKKLAPLLHAATVAIGGHTDTMERLARPRKSKRTCR